MYWFICIRNKYLRISTGSIRTYLCPYFVYVSVCINVPICICTYPRDPVSICTYPGPYLKVYPYVHVSHLYLNVSQSKSGHMYRSPYLNVYPYGSASILFLSEHIPICICLCPICVCICNLMHILPNICPAGQPYYPTHTYTTNHAPILAWKQLLARMNQLQPKLAANTVATEKQCLKIETGQILIF